MQMQENQEKIERLKGKLKQIDSHNLSEKQEAQLNSCLKKFEQCSSDEDFTELEAKVDGIIASLTTTNQEKSDPESQTGGEETGATQPSEADQAAGSQDESNGGEPTESSDASDTQDGVA